MPLDTGDLERVFRDHLSEEARSARKVLLVLGVACIAASFGGILPSKISALGIDFSNVEQKSIFFLLGAATFFYLCSFHAHSSADRRNRSIMVEKTVEKFDPDEWRGRPEYRVALRPTFGQVLFDVRFPQLLGTFGIGSILFVSEKFSPFFQASRPMRGYVLRFLVLGVIVYLFLALVSIDTRRTRTIKA